MGRSLSDVVNSLPKDRREKIHARFEELKDGVNGLRTLRKVAGKAQAKVAARLHISQPSVSKIEKQADMYLSTLTNYVSALGGELTLLVNLPTVGAFEILSLGDLASDSSEKPSIVRSPHRSAESSSSERTRSLKSKSVRA